MSLWIKGSEKASQNIGTLLEALITSIEDYPLNPWPKQVSLEPDEGSNENNFAMGIVCKLKGVDYLSEYDPLKDPDVKLEIEKIPQPSSFFTTMDKRSS